MIFCSIIAFQGQFYDKSKVYFGFRLVAPLMHHTPKLICEITQKRFHDFIQAWHTYVFRSRKELYCKVTLNSQNERFLATFRTEMDIWPLKTLYVTKYVDHLAKIFLRPHHIYSHIGQKSRL